MEVVHGIEALPLRRGPTAVTIGAFDGVHLGHRAVFRTTLEAARPQGLPAVAVTFHPHPREVLTPEDPPGLLATLERRLELIAAAGMDVAVVVEFTEELSLWPPETFAARVLAEGLGVRHAVVGTNFRFGHRAAGDLETLRRCGARLGFEVGSVPLLEVDGRVVSSSSVREALSAGDLAWPARALGRRYAVDGVVTTGAGRGRGLGFPTANLEVAPRVLLPAEGVYAGRARLDGRVVSAAINVGTNPTFGGEPLHLEAYLLDFEGDLLGRPLTVEFWARLREEARFESPEALAGQIARDVQRTRELVG